MTDKTTDKTMHRSCRAPTVAAAPLAAALFALACAMPAEAGWLARGTGVAGAGNALEENLGDLTDRFREMLDAATSDNAAKAADVWAAVEELPGRIIEDAFPAVKALLKLGDAALATKEEVKDRLESAERKIGRFVGRAGEVAADARAALAVGENERGWYESEGRLFARAPLPPVRVAAAHAPQPPLPKNDPWDAAPTTAARSPDPWAASGGGGTGGAVVHHVWDAKGTGRVAVASVWDAKGTRHAVVDDGSGGAPAADAGADDAYAAALSGVLGEDPAATAGDYQAALGAVETMEAERRVAERVAAERRQAEAARAERLQREREAREREERRLAELEERRIREQTARNNAEAWNAVMGSLTGLANSYVQIQQMKADRQRGASQPGRVRCDIQGGCGW